MLAAGAVVVAGGDAPETRSAAPPRSSASVGPTAATDPQTTQPPLPPAVAAATGAGRTPADVRTALVGQLSARADASLALLRSTHAGDDRAAAQAAQALSGSTAAVAAVVTAWEDEGVASRLRAGLDGQSQASRDYAAAVAAGDAASADAARGEMGEVSRDLGRQLDALTDGRIASYVPPQDAARQRAYVDALEAQDDAAAQETAGWLRARLAREGAALATALAGDDLP